MENMQLFMERFENLDTQRMNHFTSSYFQASETEEAEVDFVDCVTDHSIALGIFDCLQLCMYETEYCVYLSIESCCNFYWFEDRRKIRTSSK